jgi:exopolyphosphatase/guanosine-5'-triphosphate,3'-diphosphate pyrophosphatase
MTERTQSAAEERIAVVDLGSNSLRLVVFERLGGTLLPLLNEKVMCALGRGITATGRLNPDGVSLALLNLPRFVALARAIGVGHLAVIATAAVRDAADGRAFASEVARRCQVKVDIIDGAEEARLSASGVLAGIPEADGIVGDLGGGSVELIRVSRPAAQGFLNAIPSLARIGEGVTLPIGPLRLGELGESGKAVSEAIERAIAGAAVLRAAEGKTLYLVGGAWRAIARLHMEHSHYPLHIIHEYTIARGEAESFLDIIIRQSRKSLDRITTISKKRLEVVPLAALILRNLIAVGEPRRLVFSAFGLREGYAYGLIPEAERGADPLIAACQGVAAGQSRFPPAGDRLEEWTLPLFPNLPAQQRRLHRAAAWLSDTAWSEHPDYRAEQAFTRSLRVPFAAINHAERVFVASVLHARYGGADDDPVLAPTRPLLAEDRASAVRTLGLALRLAYTLCGGAVDLLNEAWLEREGERLVLEVPADDNLFVGETVSRRLDGLARSLGLTAEIRRRGRRRAASG